MAGGGPEDQLFRAVADSVQDALIAADGESRILFWSPGAERIFGRSAGDMVGRSLTALMPERFHAAHRAGIARVASGGAERLIGGQPVELAALRADGTEFPMELTIGRWERDGAAFFTGVIRDISDRRRNERLLTTQYAVAAALAGSQRIDDAVQRALAALGMGMGWRVGHLWMADDEAGRLRCREVWQRDSGSRVDSFVATSREMTFAPGEGLPGRVWESGAPAWLPDVLFDANFPRSKLAASAGLHAAVALPLVADDRVRGVAEFFTADVREGEARLVSSMQALGNQLGQFLLRREAEAELTRAHRTLELRRAFERRAADLNDDVVQQLAVARYLLDRNDSEEAARAVDSALGRAKAIVSELLADAPVEPGSLRRSVTSDGVPDTS